MLSERERKECCDILLEFYPASYKLTDKGFCPYVGPKRYKSLDDTELRNMVLALGDKGISDLVKRLKAEHSTCKGCGEPYPIMRKGQLYCDPRCRHRYHQRKYKAKQKRTKHA